MKGIVLEEAGPRFKDAAVPEPGQGQALIRVRNAALNRADVVMASGQSHGRAGGPGTVLGLEWAGVIEKLGAGCSGLAVGDRVMCSGLGGFAEFAVADASRLMTIPDALDFETAATLPVALQTMHNAVITAGAMKKGEAVLVQGASSGVGLMAMQIAKLMGAGLVIGTSTNDARRARLTEFGADLAIDTRQADWPAQVKEATGGRGVDVIIDQVSGDLVNQNISAAAILGRIVNVGRLGGRSASFDCEMHALKRISYVGVTFRTRTADEVREINRLMKADLWPAVEDGRLRLPVDHRFPLSEGVAALERMRQNQHFGKIVLAMA
ncbi:MAG: zinc-binding dehydrogenase [Hyphomicrobiaceae bacterium]|nr:zinc-binding dehydrogenase [Hyphomicrobiaceae bacterium]